MSYGIFDVLGPCGKLSMEMKLAFTEEGKGANASLKSGCTMVKWAAALFSRTSAKDEEFAAVSLVC